MLVARQVVEVHGRVLGEAAREAQAAVVLGRVGQRAAAHVLAARVRDQERGREPVQAHAVDVVERLHGALVAGRERLAVAVDHLQHAVVLEPADHVAQHAAVRGDRVVDGLAVIGDGAAHVVRERRDQRLRAVRVAFELGQQAEQEQVVA